MKGEHLLHSVGHPIGFYQTGLISVVKLHSTNAGHKFKIQYIALKSHTMTTSTLLYTVYRVATAHFMYTPHLCAMADSLCFFFKRQQAAMVTVVRPAISAATATITPTNRPMFSALGAGSGVIMGTETQRGSK